MFTFEKPNRTTSESNGKYKQLGLFQKFEITLKMEKTFRKNFRDEFVLLFDHILANNTLYGYKARYIDINKVFECLTPKSLLDNFLQDKLTSEEKKKILSIFISEMSVAPEQVKEDVNTVKCNNITELINNYSKEQIIKNAKFDFNKLDFNKKINNLFEYAKKHAVRYEVFTDKTKLTSELESYLNAVNYDQQDQE